VNDLVLIHIRF